MVEWLQGREQTYVFIPFVKVEDGKYVKLKEKVNLQRGWRDRPFSLNPYTLKLLKGKHYYNFLVENITANVNESIFWLPNGGKMEIVKDGNTIELTTPPCFNVFDIAKHSRVNDSLAMDICNSLNEYLRKEREDEDVKVFAFELAADENYECTDKVEELWDIDDECESTLGDIGACVASLFKPCIFREAEERNNRIHISYERPPSSDLARIATHLTISTCLADEKIWDMFGDVDMRYSDILKAVYKSNLLNEKEREVMKYVLDLGERKKRENEHIKKDIAYTIYAENLISPFETQKRIIRGIENSLKEKILSEGIGGKIKKQLRKLKEKFGVEVYLETKDYVLESVSESSIFKDEDIKKALFIPPTPSSLIRVYLLNYFKNRGDATITADWRVIKVKEDEYVEDDEEVGYEIRVAIPLKLKNEKKGSEFLDKILTLLEYEAELRKEGINVFKSILYGEDVIPYYLEGEEEDYF